MEFWDGHLSIKIYHEKYGSNYFRYRVLSKDPIPKLVLLYYQA